MLKKIMSLLTVVTVLFVVQFANAADTTEAFDIGATDFEFYLGYDGFGLSKYEGAISAEAVLGYGFTKNFSGCVAVGGESNEYFGDGSGSVAFGLFYTAFDSDHFDLDFMLGGSAASQEFALTPGLELNFDIAPDLAVWGLYVRAEEELASRDESIEDDKATATIDESATKFVFAPATALTIGTYWTVAEGHQLLLEYDMTFANNPVKAERTIEYGAVALGYNVGLSDSIEMINQLAFDIPQSGDEFSVGINIGLIITMPSVVGGD